MCVLTNERYKVSKGAKIRNRYNQVPHLEVPKHIRRDFYSVAWVMPQGWHFGVPRGSKTIFKHGHVTYQIDRDDEQNRMQVKFSS